MVPLRRHRGRPRRLLAPRGSHRLPFGAQGGRPRGPADSRGGARAGAPVPRLARPVRGEPPVDRGHAGLAAEPDGLGLRRREGGREAGAGHDPLRHDRLGRPGHGVSRVRARARELVARLRTAAVEEPGGRPGRHGRAHRHRPRHARSPRRQDRAQGRALAPRRRLRRHRLRAVAALGGQRSPADALRLRHRELPVVVPDEPDHPRDPRRDRHRRRDRARRRGGRAHLPRALPARRSRSAAPSRSGGSSRRAS